IGYLCLFGVPFIFFDIYFFKSYNFIIFYSISEFYSIFNLTVPTKALENPQILGFLDCFTAFAMTVRKVIRQKSGGGWFAST
ncbi:hypothetical protein, partial [Candidatus Bandiella numerosa]|uniref:hypothetical protein n=1 Tax=Candidatus Bandiella numerosa TaxID=2570586 RepID=UPI001F40CE9F